MDKFRELGVEVVGVSIDSQFTHHAWRSTPVEKGGIGAVEFTMVADVKHRSPAPTASSTRTAWPCVLRS